ncbi:MAG: ABC transporter substrate-binding protein [Lentisphaeria bacterium]|nr:ABC transporter substrate-binding protein [Lentisphaeria bacterium]
MRRLFRFFFLFSLALCLAACSEEKKGAPGGVVSLSPALTELVCHLGREDRLIARSTACDWPESVKSLPTAGDFAEPELERILAMKPALVVSNEFVNPKDADALRQAGIAVELHPCDGFDDYREWVARMGCLLDCPDEAGTELKRADARIAEFESDLKIAPGKPLRALYVIWDSPLLTAGADSLPDAVGRLAGLENIVKSEKGYPSISLEFVLKEDPDVIVWFAHGKDWKSNPSWSGIRAIRQGHVLIPRDDSALLRPGPRIFDGIADLKSDLKKMFPSGSSAEPEGAAP